ncbi:MAG: matrixin family metalloprotease [Persicimonas sp.]
MLLAVTLLAVATPASAEDYVRTTTCDENDPNSPQPCDDDEDPLPIYWPKTCVAYRINEEGTDNAVDVDEGLTEELESSVIESFETWTDVDCTGLRIEYGGETSDDYAGFNDDSDAVNRNVIMWRDEDWSEVTSSQAFALTSVSYHPDTGEIADADIEINSDLFDINVTSEPDDEDVDLRNTLIHEIGHFIGLDHTDEREATMYGSARLGETKKRTLHQVDIDGICDIYPEDEAPESCDPDSDDPVDAREVFKGSSNDDDDDSTCATTASSPIDLAALVVLVGLLAAPVRRFFGK